MPTPHMCVPAAPQPWYMPWADLVSFRPPASVQEYVHSRTPTGFSLDPRHLFNWAFHYVEPTNMTQGALLQLNLDYYPVTISRLPNHYGGTDFDGRTYGVTDIDGKPIRMTPEAFVRELRMDIVKENPYGIVDTTNSQFYPYDDRYPSSPPVDAARWSSSDPVNTIISIAIHDPVAGVNVDDGSVVCSEYSSRHWRLSTIWTTRDQGHPVSGTREWRLVEGDTPGTYVFFTRGADRPTNVIDRGMGALNVPWKGADALWQSLQAKVCSLVNGQGGIAVLGDARCSTSNQAPYYASNRISKRVYWNDVAGTLWRPTQNWIYPSAISGFLR